MTMRTEIAWTTDPQGLLLGARYHDGNLCDFGFSGDGIFRFGIAPVGGGRTEIVLRNVRHFGFQDFVDGGILNDIRIHRLGAMPELLWDADDNPWRVLFCYLHDVDRIRPVAAQLIAAEPDMMLVSIDGSFGGNFAALCGAVAVFGETP
ncbi:MAG: hypothetical protein WDN01_21815 [Rhizomicrobium sp.]